MIFQHSFEHGFTLLREAGNLGMEIVMLAAGGGRTEVVHHRRTSHKTEENMPVGAGEFPVGELSDLQCQGY